MMPVYPQYCPGREERPWFYPTIPPYIPPAPRGRWIWIDEDDGMCDACRRGGVCMCYRPERDSAFVEVGTFGPVRVSLTIQ